MGNGCNQKQRQPCLLTATKGQGGYRNAEGGWAGLKEDSAGEDEGYR